MSEIIKKKIVIVGSRGMLGSMVAHFFSKKLQVTHFEQRFGEGDRFGLIDEINKLNPFVVINAIGAIPQKHTTLVDQVWANILWPGTVATYLKSDIKLVHASTDCVFDGLAERAYSVDSRPSARDGYGWSKAVGESALMSRPNTLILRNSIIGPNPISKTGLYEWVLSQRAGATIPGYVDHIWNGITTLEWCNQAYQLLDSIEGPARVLQLGTALPVSKYELLCQIAEYFRPDLAVDQVVSGSRINRELIPTLICKPMGEQLQELRRAMQSG